MIFLIGNYDIKKIFIQGEEIKEVRHAGEVVWSKPAPVKKYRYMTAVIDQDNNDGLKCVTYAEDAKDMKKMTAAWDSFFGTKLVLFKNGKEVRELKDSELDNLKAEDGDVMVKFKRMGLNSHTEGNKVYITMTDNPRDNRFKYYAHTRGNQDRDAFYLGAYLGSSEGGKLRSLTGKGPLTGCTIGQLRNYAQANGKGYEICGFYQLTFLQAMYVLKYGDLNSQRTVGMGLVEGNKNTPNESGKTNGKGIDCGSESPKEHVRFQFIEDFFGNRGWRIDGINTDDDYNILTTTDNFNDEGEGYTKVGKSLELDGIISKVHGNSELGLFAKEIDDSFEDDNAFGYRDGVYATSGSTGGWFGGDVYYGSRAGAFCLIVGDDASGANWGDAARLMFL